MPHERTFGEEEVAEIFRAASAADARRDAGAETPVPARGLTLAELQSIGREVGLPPERVAEAAAGVGLRPGIERRTELGMPVSVGRTVELPRAPTDREWEMIVADLRETFGARGHVASRGEAREWTNGNLHVYVEPTGSGCRLRLRTTKSNALAINRMAAVVAAMGLFLLLPFLVSYHGESFFPPVMLLAMGLGMLALNALRLPGWADDRETQMEEVAARARALLGGALQPPPAGDPVAGAD
jgi:hypothetical protein